MNVGGDEWCSVAWSYRGGPAAAVPGVKQKLTPGKQEKRRQRQRGELLWVMTKRNYSGREKREREEENGEKAVRWEGLASCADC